MSKDKNYDKLINKTKLIPMGDDDIKKFLPDAKIITYDELKNYKSIDQLLPNEKDYAIILYLNSKNNGHWIAIMKNKDKKDKTIIEYFDSYGNPIDQPLLWWNEEHLEGLGVDDIYLTKLLNKSGYKTVYNKEKYQNGNPDIKSCGRHIVFRLLNHLKGDLDLASYNKIMKQLKKDLKCSYDQIVSGFVNSKTANL